MGEAVTTTAPQTARTITVQTPHDGPQPAIVTAIVDGRALVVFRRAMLLGDKRALSSTWMWIDEGLVAELLRAGNE